jgi:hypothetical protein
MTLHTRIRFEEPPAKIHGNAKRSKHRKIADKLRKVTGEWAHIGTYDNASSANSVAHLIRRGKIAAYAPEGTFEAVARTTGGKHGIWARHTGPDGDHT